MKKTLVTTLSLLLSFIVFAQERPYYYCGGQKVYLKVTPDMLHVKLKEQPVRIPYAPIVPRSRYLDAARVLPYSNIRQVPIPVADRRMALQDIRQDSNIVYSWEALTLEKVPVIPTGEILVKPLEGYRIRDIVSRLGLTDSVDIIPYDTFHFGTEILRIRRDEQLFRIANKIYESGVVVFSHPNFYVPTSGQTNDPYYIYMSWFHNSNIPGMDVNIEPVWPLIAQAPGYINVVVIDDGLEPHEDIARLNPTGWTPRRPGAPGNWGAPSSADKSHAMGVAGIIMADANNHIGVAGVYQNAGAILGVNIFYDNNETVNDYANAINYAWQYNHADVINNSWNFHFENQPGYDAIKNAIQSAEQQGRNGLGTLVVFSAGNDGGNIQYPANVENVVTVGAIEENGTHPGYSATGPSLELVAVSPMIQPTTDRMGANGYSSGNYRSTFGYTSGAAPQVSGVIANMLLVNKELPAAMVRDMLMETATDLGTPGYDITYGAGLVNGCRAVVAAIINALGLKGDCNWNGPEEIYELTGVPSGPLQEHITWSVYPDGLLNLYPSGVSVRLTKNGEGPFLLTASLGTYCGREIKYTQICITNPEDRMGSTFQVSPVPAGTMLTVKSLTDERARSVVTGRDIRQVKIADRMGHIVLQQSFTAGTRLATINVGGLQDGYYIIYVDNGNGWSNANGRHIIIRH
ncbi:S8 family peptidase [Chitinophaga pendula]|uniref:S8 family serine peptidase n=1 Tax=Chitinophaga TaxID=79328 RepID=UPI000BAF8FD7|nr:MULTISPECIES: S8 family serine peptidase [Chitinophaga]ASZ14441.1 hypothetical protein CK934_27595 [Chitinophaga sp. MD30]UCJ07904.1 S8 family peptidase [Chitinophaga pendula]